MKLSVVLSVYNGARSLGATLDSILGQTMRDFELIVVDDGSTDETSSILARYASRDERVRVFSQQNAGLTRGLIRGCDEAKGAFIARHDCGDRSHPERFARQALLLEQGHVLVCCATRFTDAEGDTLYVSSAEGNALREGLLSQDVAHIHGPPHHGSVMFRSDAYRAAGGYRVQFRAAQDLDLWIRIAAQGTFGVDDEILYEATLEADNISATNRQAQMELTALAVALRDGGSKTRLLEAAARVKFRSQSRCGEAAAIYFIARCLLQQGNPKWRRTMWNALRRNPLHCRAWASLLIGR